MWCYVVLCGVMWCCGGGGGGCIRGRVACCGACGDGGRCAGACVVVVLHLMLCGVSFLRVAFVIKFGYKSTYN